ncbi:MAG: type IV pilus assembly protein PilM [Patescibacteria group bacterium]
MAIFNEKVLIGLDIGTHSIKMVEIARAGDKLNLKTYAIASHNLPIEGYWDGSRLRQFGQIIQDLLDQGNFAGIKTVVGVHSQDVYVTTMDFDASWQKSQIKEQIDKQAPYFLPYPPDEMRLSWSIIQTDPKILQYTGKQRVIITALPDFVIENSRNLLEHVDLDGVALENQTISQIRCSLGKDRGNTILVDVGANITTMSILVDGILRSSSHFPIGAQQITTNLMSELGVDEEAAESFKKDLGLVNLYQLPIQFTDFQKNLRSEVQHYWELNRKSAQPANKIIFTGGAVMTAGFLEAFRGFPIPIFLANPLGMVSYAPELSPYLVPVSNQLSTAIGLAMRKDV